MGNTINSMTAHTETLEKERRFMMGSHQYHENRHNSVSERYQFGYDSHQRSKGFRGEERRMIDKGSPSPPRNHRPGKETMRTVQGGPSLEMQDREPWEHKFRAVTPRI